ncbi:MAG: hypothetical protein WC607_01035 [Candidatus Micrarchaeia archaeon]
MQLDGYTLVILLFIFATLFTGGTGAGYSDFAPVHAAAAIIMIPLQVFAFFGFSSLIGLIAAFALLMYLGDQFGEGVVTVGLFAFTILLLGA